MAIYKKWTQDAAFDIVRHILRQIYPLLMDKNIPSPLSFADFPSFFRAVSTVVAPKGKPRLPDADWAKKLGYGSRRTVGMIREGRRVPSGQFLERLGRFLGQTDAEKKYLTLLSRLNKKIAVEEKMQVSQELEQLRSSGVSRTVLQESQVNHVAHWYNLAIKQLVSQPGFNPNPHWIYKRLKGKVALKAIEKSLHQMVRLGILEKIDGPTGYRVIKKSITTTADLPTAAIRLHHLEQLQRAREAIMEVPVQLREIYSLTLSFDPARILEAKGVIRKFMDEFDQRFSSPAGKQVYQVGMQFFPHTGEE